MHGFEYLGLITLASREFRVPLAVLPASLRCLRILASSVSHGVATPPFLPTLTVYYRGSLYWVVDLCGVGPVFSVTFALFAQTIPAPVLGLALRSAAAVAVFSPISAVFRASFGDFCSCFGILALPLLFLGYAYGVAFFASSPYSPLLSILR